MNIANDNDIDNNAPT